MEVIYCFVVCSIVWVYENFFCFWFDFVFLGKFFEGNIDIFNMILFLSWDIFKIGEVLNWLNVDYKYFFYNILNMYIEIFIYNYMLRILFVYVVFY